MAPRYLTKSRFKLALSCPTKLYYTGKPDYANANDDNEFLAMLADGGFQVGELAKLMYPTGIEIKSKNSAEALAETALHLAQDQVILFEPAIAHGNFLVRVDVLIKRGTVLEVIEVKAKSYSGDPASLSGKRKAIAADILPYVQDVAFQKYVTQLAFPHSTVSAHLLMPDKSKHATVNGMNQLFKVRRNGRNIDVLIDDRARQPGLAETVLTCVSVDHLANEVLNNDIDISGGQGSIQQLSNLWADAYERDERLTPIIGAQCGRCEYRADPGSDKASGFHECWKLANQWRDEDFAHGTVLDIWNFRGKDKLIQAGVVKLNQVTDEDIKLTDDDFGPLTHAQRQWLQINGLPDDCLQEGYYLDRAGLAHEMQSWTYPLHLIDFETAAVALPFHTGRRPYEQVAFQFSHHVLEHDGSVRHADEFLSGTPGELPNYAFVRALREALRHDLGTVMRWSHHENSILNAIKTQLTMDASPPNDTADLIAFIDNVTKGGERAMVDLADVARKHYFHPSTKGSCSIKKVLPAVLQSSPALKATYSQPVYGAKDGIPSKNFVNMVWWQQDVNKEVLDPYKLLVAELGNDAPDEEVEGINQGGAASYAYLRLQFEDLSDPERLSIERGLLRYCELDTLAMVMILQGWLS
ncbi:MAG: hypothetical protein BWK72_19805 [Rhodoferax ferrireducens]|uniref:DUF2779 domain-containing protein n=1 Tax=Rhodoferax ferrireducens TaxID=192843 RepID=A0A1W9KP32_9BURK|nr:MAG: hypothetical protein BWK72_19805 [Rhodoferax ferrireducens]